MPTTWNTWIHLEILLLSIIIRGLFMILFWKHASEISTNQLQGSEWMKICLSECFTFEDARNMEDFLTTAPIAHPMFIWEIDKFL